MTIVTRTDRPKSVRNRCVIEVSGGVFVLSIGFEFSVGIGVFVIWLSQISFFISWEQLIILPQKWKGDMLVYIWKIRFILMAL